MHPLLLILLVVIVLGLIQRLAPAKTGERERTQKLALGVVLVAPPKADVETRLKAMLSLCAHPKSVKFYVAKLCDAGERPAELGDMQLRIATRLHFVRARRSTPERLRASLVREVLEPYTLCTSWHHDVEWGWDDMLLHELNACRDATAVLTNRLVDRAVEPGFPHVEAYDQSSIALGHTPFAIPPSYPQPAIVCSAQLLFGPTAPLQRGWPAKEDVADGVHEDATLTAFLWMRGGVRFYCPHNQPLFAEVGHAAREAAGRIALPAATNTARTREEFWTAIGIRRGRASSRARAGLTVQASVDERYHKVGQTIAIHRDI